MSIVVTGGTGAFGAHAVEALRNSGVPAEQIVATGRRALPGVVHADYDNPEQLRAAFAGAEKVLFVSGSEVGQRVRQHTNVVTAAKEAGVGLLAYTSIVRADTSDLLLAAEHKETEQLIRDSGVPFVFLRNSWYLENYDFRSATEHGLFGAAGEGRISAAARADYAEAAVAALLRAEPGTVYELGGPGITLAELAAAIGRAAGKDVAYTDLTPEKYTEFLVSVGVPEQAAAVYADSDHKAAQGALEVDPRDLETLLGRPATPVADVIRAALS